MGRDAPEERPDRVNQGKERGGQKLLRLSDPAICMEPKCPYSSWFKDPEEMEVPAAWPRRKSSVLGAVGCCRRRTRAVSPQRPKQLLIASHRSISATRLPYQAIAVQGSRRRRRHHHVTIWERSSPHCPKDPSSRGKCYRKVGRAVPSLVPGRGCR